MTADIENCIEVIIPGQPIVKPIELKNFGFLQKQSTYVNCPSCMAETMSIVRLEVVTCWQKLLQFTGMCKTSDGRCDINHYCQICGCYIGRYIELKCSQKCLSKRARRMAANDALTLRPKDTDCCQKLQEACNRISENMAKEREETRKKQNETNSK